MSSGPQLLDERLTSTGSERLWPLDAALAALGGLVLYIAATRLRWDDPRWQYNAWTYMVGAALGVVVLALLLRKLTGHVVQRSVQLGFLISLFVHLLLLVVAVNVVIFTRFWPDAFTGTEVVGRPIRKTVPEYVFQQRPQTTQQPDWARPVDAETASPEATEQQRTVPPLDNSAVRLQMPQPQPPLTEVLPTPLRKQTLQAAQPSPAGADAPLARRQAEVAPLVPSPIEVPDVPVAAEASLDLPDRRDAQVQRAEPQGATATLPTRQPPVPATAPQQQLRLRPLDDLPRLGDTATPTRPPSPRERSSAVPPVGASPAVPTYRIARSDADADRLLSPQPSPATRASTTPGANLGLPGLAGPAETPLAAEPQEPLAQRSAAATTAGMPLIDAGEAAQASGRARLDLRNTPPLAVDPLQELRALPEAAVADAADTPGDGPLPARRDALARRDLDTDASRLPATAPLPVEIAALDGPAGLARRPASPTGLAAIPEVPDVAALDLTPPRRERQQVGAPQAPAGSEVASVESFLRRTRRTAGGASPAPAGALGPQTEEAIERGLMYLASRQNADGSWSLQGEGERVLLRSDTAATGMCLLAFQGAGYTHRRHQYANTVARGLQFLLDNQKANGDLYRAEDPLSNQNVWLYSHAIAALALCEAYGMSQDPELRQPAQRSIDFIAASQHPSRGGWRYTPQNSSDTSVTGWMMMALKSGELSGLQVSSPVYEGIEHWLAAAQPTPARGDRYRYNPYAADTPSQRHGRVPTPTMTAVGMLMRLYLGWHRENPMMQSGADYLNESLPAEGTPQDPKRDTYYWYYATQVMFHMGGDYWKRWNGALNPLLVGSQQRDGALAGSWDPRAPVPDRWAAHGGRLYVTAMNLLSLEVYYRHLPIYEETAK